MLKAAHALKGNPLHRVIAPLVFFLFLSGCNHKRRPINAVSPDVTSKAIDVVIQREEQERKKLLLAAQEYIRAAEKVKVIDEPDERVRVCEAKIVDIPIPLGVFPLERYFLRAEPAEGREIIFGYASEVTADTLGVFFKREMAFSGWHLICQINGVELIMVFEKPSKSAVIAIRPFEALNRRFPCQLTIAIGATAPDLEE